MFGMTICYLRMVSLLILYNISRNHGFQVVKSLKGGIILDNRSLDAKWGIRKLTTAINRRLWTSETTTTRRYLSSKDKEEQTLSASSYKKIITPGSGVHESEEHVTKKSRFIGYASYVSSWSEAQTMFDTIKLELHPKARHWCYAYVGGNDEERSSDDGEPSGTGGQPILSAIKTSNIVDVMCIVVRYYGGIQLGTGGLIRAYGFAAREVLKFVPTQVQIPTASVRVTVEPLWIGILYDTIQKASCWVDDTEPTSYHDDGSVSITVKCYTHDIDQFKNTLHNLTKGTATF